MASFNKVIVMGNLTRDIDVKVTQSGLSIGRAGIAVNEKVKKGTDYVDEVMFIDCTLFGKTADLAAQYLSKGSQVFFEGRLKLEQWEKDGVKHSKHTIIVDKMQFIGGKQDGGGERQQSSKSSGGYRVPKQDQLNSHDDESDVPF